MWSWIWDFTGCKIKFHLKSILHLLLFFIYRLILRCLGVNFFLINFSSSKKKKIQQKYFEFVLSFHLSLHGCQTRLNAIVSKTDQCELCLKEWKFPKWNSNKIRTVLLKFWFLSHSLSFLTQTMPVSRNYYHGDWVERTEWYLINQSCHLRDRMTGK